MMTMFLGIPAHRLPSCRTYSSCLKVLLVQWQRLNEGNSLQKKGTTWRYWMVSLWYLALAAMVTNRSADFCFSSVGIAFNGFTRFGRSSPKWCASHRLNFKALSRAVAIRKQLRKYLDRFDIRVESCQGDAQRLRRCLVTGYFKVRWWNVSFAHLILEDLDL